MSIRILRNNLRSWIEQYISIQSWDLDVPANVPRVINDNGTDRRFPANCAIELPIRELTITRAEDQVEGEALFQYLILYRFNGRAAKKQLPMGNVELIVNFLCERAAFVPGEIWEDVISIETETVNEAVSLGRVEGEDGDWLLIAKPEFRIRFVSRAQDDLATDGTLQPATGLIDAPVTLSSLSIAVNASDKPVTTLPDTFNLDLLLELPE
jgi:hypothetical protein